MQKTKTYLTVKDHSVSGEEFKLVKNDQLGYLETHPQPSLDNLPKYYESENYISHTDSKRNVLEKIYHFVRTIALKRKLKLINSFNNSEKNLLDVGCGTGDFLDTAKKDSWKITGIEPNEKARQIANSKTNHSVFEIEYLTKLKANSFDVITLWHVLEHLPKLNEHIIVFNKLLKDQGRLVVAVPNHKSYDAAYYKEFWAAYDVPRHLWHFSQKAIEQLFKEVGMEVCKTLPMKFDSFYVSLLSEKYKTGRMNYVKAFFIGLRSNIKAKSSGEYSSLIYVLKKAENPK